MPPSLNSPRYTFPLLAPGHLPLLFDWLHQPHVATFWSPPPADLQTLDDKYFGPEAEREEGLFRHIIMIDDRPAGLIQRYLVADRSSPYWPWLPEATIVLKMPPVERAIGIDLFIGDPAQLGHGHAVPIIHSFAATHCADAPLLVIDPEQANSRAIHVYQKAGFRMIRQFDGQPPNMKPVPHLFMAMPNKKHNA